jgi:hypothetical protein
LQVWASEYPSAASANRALGKPGPELNFRLPGKRLSLGHAGLAWATPESIFEEAIGQTG